MNTRMQSDIVKVNPSGRSDYSMQSFGQLLDLLLLSQAAQYSGGSIELMFSNSLNLRLSQSG